MIPEQGSESYNGFRSKLLQHTLALGIAAAVVAVLIGFVACTPGEVKSASEAADITCAVLEHAIPPQPNTKEAELFQLSLDACARREAVEAAAVLLEKGDGGVAAPQSLVGGCEKAPK